MFPPTAGPFALTDRLTPIPPPARPSWSGIVADALGGAAGLRAQIDQSAADLAGAGTSDASAAYDGTLGATPDALTAATAETGDRPAGELDQAGQRVSGRAEQVRGYLPNASTDVQMGFIDPPQAPQPGDQGPPGFVGPPSAGHGSA